jgi:hypothetical protein
MDASLMPQASLMVSGIGFRYSLVVLSDVVRNAYLLALGVDSGDLNVRD